MRPSSSATKSHACSLADDRAERGRPSRSRSAASRPRARREHLVGLVGTGLADGHAAAAISPASRALPTIRSRFAAQRAAAALAVEPREHERRHRLAVHAGRVRLGERLLDQRLDVVEALVRRAAEQQAAAAELPVRRRDRAPPRPPTRRAPTPAARRRRRRRAAACRCASRAPARRASRAARPSRARRAATSRPTRSRAPASDASTPRSAETSGGVGQPRCTPPRPPVAMKRIPAALQTASVPPTVVAPTAPCTDGRGQVARADLARRRVEARRARPRSARRRSRRRGSPIVAGTAPPSRTARSEREPDLDALAGREAVRDERRLERDHAAARRRARRAPPRRRGSRHRPELRAAARRRLEPGLDAADEEARRERVAGAGRVDDLGRHGRERLAVDDDAVRAALHDPASPSARPSASRSRSTAKTSVGRERSRPRAERVVDQRPRREVERDLRAGRARELARPQRRRGDRLPHQRVPGHVQSIAAEPLRLELVRRGARARCRGRRPSSARPRRRSRPRRRCARRPARRPRRRAPRSSRRDELAGRVGAALA